ncbi:MAG TPA: hypothetical protein VFZ40_03775 [Pyrinomonadaceae bacterium]
MRKISTARLIVAMVSIFFLNLVAQGQSRQELLGQIENKRAELQTLQEKFLAPSDGDRSAFSEFLKQPNTGLVRLLPRESFGEVPDKPSKLTIRGGGAYYSFVRLTHEYGYGSDIELEQNHLRAGFAGADYGIMTMIDEVPLENVTSDLSPVAFLLGYTPPTEEPEVRQEQRLFLYAGKMIDGLTYRGRLPVKVNGTYLLRSISFYNSDVLVAIRIVRKDSDDSLIIAWKLLQKFPKPELIRSTASR